MSERNSKGQFVRGNKLGKKGYRSLVENKFGGDKLAFRAFLSVCGKRGWDALVEKQFAGDEDLAKEYLRAQGMYGYGLQYIDPKTGTYYPWVKTCFRQEVGDPQSFLAKRSSSLEFTLNDVPELEC